MKKKAVTILLSISSIVISMILIYREVAPKIVYVEVKVTLAKSVTRTIGNTEYKFKLYRYDAPGLYLLRVEKGNSFKTKVVVPKHTYYFLDLGFW